MSVGASASGRSGGAARRRLRLEPWGVGYAGSAQDVGGAFSGDDEPTDGRGHLDDDALSVEVPIGAWRPLRPAAPLAVARAIFLDGVRRVDARAVLEGASEADASGADAPEAGAPGADAPASEEPPAFGALGSCAVGAVVCDLVAGGRAELLEDVVVERWCAIVAGVLGALEDVVVPAGPDLRGGARLTFRVTRAAGTDWDAPVAQLQVEMREAERRMAERLQRRLRESGEQPGTAGRALLVCDGPRPLYSADENVIGYLKTIKEQRLPAQALAVVRRLEEGERSPIYLVDAGERARFEWYVRLRDPRPWLHTLAGSVRVQAYAGPQPGALLTTARGIADWSAATLPRFATKAHQDPRAPQQLLPVRSLEAALRRRLGNAPLVRRRIEVALAAGSTEGAS